MQAEQVWQAYKEHLQRFIASKVNNPADVDDVMQQILMALLTRLETLQQASSVKPWLFQIAHHAIIDFYRQQARVRQLTEQDLWYQDTEQAEHALAACIQPFIQCLSEDDAALLTAIDLHGQSQKVYATQSGIPYSTLKTRVQKARAALKKAFLQCCEISSLSQYDKKPGCEGC